MKIEVVQKLLTPAEDAYMIGLDAGSAVKIRDAATRWYKYAEGVEACGPTKDEVYAMCCALYPAAVNIKAGGARLIQIISATVLFLFANPTHADPDLVAQFRHVVTRLVFTGHLTES